MEDAPKSTPGPACPKPGRAEKASLVKAAGIALVMLCVAFTAGTIIRQVRLASTPPQVATQTEEGPVPQDDLHPGPGPLETLPVVYAPVPEEQFPEAATGLEEVPLAEPEPPAPVEPAPPWPRMGQGFGGWNLNLTGEEQARLREGFMDLIQRFQAMPEEERQAQMAQFNALRERFEGMSDQERQQTLLRMWQVFQQWRQTGGSVEDLVNGLWLD